MPDEVELEFHYPNSRTSVSGSSVYGFVLATYLVHLDSALCKQFFSIHIVYFPILD